MRIRTILLGSAILIQGLAASGQQVGFQAVNVLLLGPLPYPSISIIQHPKMPRAAAEPVSAGCCTTWAFAREQARACCHLAREWGYQGRTL